ncbi:MAG: glutamine synthetase type III, partial [Candidatus Methanomethylophilaceae archaeon]|nr:glutamine synthetase type III [Candidatus Methanomethylophilaceae archaeon]
ANEAPPMIISAFLGSQLKEVFEEMLKSRSLVKMGKRPGYSIGIPQIPEILVDNTDRNRTSPFAFVGDRFEFRAVGSSANCSLAITTVNTIVADELALFISKLDEKISAGVSKEQAILETVREYYGVCKGICFDGNNYSEEWREEAARRGLDCETSVPKVYEALLSESTVGAYERTKVLTRSELEARAEVLWEQYSLKTEIEARVMSDMVLNHILPVATSYQTMLLENVSKIKDAFPPEEFDALAGNEVDLIRDISRHMYEARRMARETDLLCDQLERIDDARERALGFHDTIRPYLDDEREHADSLEMIVDDQMWPLPKYREMLFIH